MILFPINSAVSSAASWTTFLEAVLRGVCQITYPTSLLPYAPRVLRILVSHVPRALCALVPHLSCVLLALVSHVLCALRPSCLVYSRVSRALCLTCLVLYVLFYLTCYHALCPSCLTSFMCQYHLFCSCFPMLRMTFSYLFATCEVYCKLYYS